MSRLYAVIAPIAEVASHFGAEIEPGLTVPSETIEGDPGLIVLARGGGRMLKLLTWGFPRLDEGCTSAAMRPAALASSRTSPTICGTRWVPDPRYRCLIPLTHFANPDGEPGEKTRTWFAVKGQPIVAWAGFCRNTPEFGPVFAGMTMAANAAIPPTNDRMPVLLDPPEYDTWLRGSIEDVIGFQFRPPFAAERMNVIHTADRWRSGKLPKPPQLALL